MEAKKEVKQRSKGEEEVIEATGITAKQINAVRNYVSSRLGGNIYFEYDSIEGYRDESLEMTSKPVDKKMLGLFGIALTQCVVVIRLWAKSKTGSVHLCYNHVGGGSNGCEMGINLIVSGDVVTEML